MTTATVITNPRSGHGKHSERIGRSIARLRETCSNVDVVQATSAAGSASLAREAVAAGVDVVVAAGGDGLISAVLQAVATTDVPFGIIPAGTGNDLAREFGVPVDDPLAAADIIAAIKTKSIDLGLVDGTYFATVLASGFDSRVTDRANLLKWPTGPMRYNVAIALELARLRAVPYRIELDDQVIEMDAIMVAVGNTRSYGGGMLVAPSALADDGLLDVTIIGRASRVKLVTLFPTIYKGTHIKVEGVTTYRSKSVRLAAPNTTAYADGEPFGSLPKTITCVPGAAKICVPAARSDQAQLP